MFKFNCKILVQGVYYLYLYMYLFIYLYVYISVVLIQYPELEGAECLKDHKRFSRVANPGKHFLLSNIILLLVLSKE